jgi:hypothetical protein
MKSEDNVVYKNKGTAKSKFTFLQHVKWLVYENTFMERLFPLIK